jgi:predicted nucleic acid-binding Zn ribbon protein
VSTLQIPNHSHCVVCSRAVPFGDKTCSPECQAQLDELNKKRKRSMLVMYGLMAAAVLVFLLSFRGGLGG